MFLGKGKSRIVSRKWLYKQTDIHVCEWTIMFVHTGTHTHSQVGVTRGNVKNSLGKQLSLNTVERPACPVAARGGGYSAISVESAQSDSIEVAYDISSMRMMTVHKASTNQKHGPSASLKNESLKFYF